MPAACCVLTGQVQAIVRQRHRAVEFLARLRRLDRLVPHGQGIHLLLDPVRLHCSAGGARCIDDRPARFAFHWLPKHASWLSFIEAWFAIPSKKCRKRRALADFAAAEHTSGAFVATYNAHQAKPFTWRKGVKFDQRLTDQLAALPADTTALPEAA